MATSEEVTSQEIDEFKDLYDVAGLTDEEIAVIIGESEGKRGRFDEQRLIGQAMRAKGHRGSSYDPRTGVNVSGGLLGLGADIFERYRGMKKEEEGIAGLEGMEANDQEQMRIRIERMRQMAQAAQPAQAAAPQGPMGPPQAPPPQAAPQAAPPMPQAPQPQIPSQMPNLPQDQFAIGAGGDTSRDIGGRRGVVSVGDIPPPPAPRMDQGDPSGIGRPGGLGPRENELEARINAELPPIGAASAGTPSGMGGLTLEEQESVKKWLQGLRR